MLTFECIDCVNYVGMKTSSVVWNVPLLLLWLQM